MNRRRWLLVLMCVAGLPVVVRGGDLRAALEHLRVGQQYLSAPSVSLPIAERADQDPDLAARRLQNLELALGEFQQAVEKAPDLFEAQLALAQCLLSLDRRSEAIPALEAAAALRSNDGGVCKLLGQARKAAGLIGPALSAFRDAARLAPLDPESLAPLADLLEQTGDHRGALDAFRRLRALDRNNPTYLRGLARNLIAVGDDRSAGVILAHLNRIEPGNLDSLVQIGRLEYRMGRYDRAVAMLEPVVKARPDDGEALLYLGVARAELGDQEAAQILRRAALRLGNDARQLGLLASGFDQLLLLEEATKTLERAQRALPAPTGFESRLAVHYLAAQRPQEAAKLLLRASRAEAVNSLDINSWLLWLAVSKGRPDAADELLARRAIFQRPGWQSTCANHLLGRVPRHDLLRLARERFGVGIHSAEPLETWLLIGIKADRDGDRAAALAAYERYVGAAAGARSDAVQFARYRLADLRRLR